MEVRPFKALRPAPGYERRIAALPYDVVELAEARRLVAEEPMSFLAVDLPEQGFPDDVDPLAPAIFHRAQAAFQRLVQAGGLVEDDEPALYVYRLGWHGNEQTGLVGCFAVDDYLDGTIAKHEVTRAAKEEGRVRHIRALDAQTGLVFLTWRAGADDALVQTLAKATEGEPLYSFVDAYDVSNEVWRITGDAMDEIVEAADTIPKAYIADGHHRAAAAARHCLERRESAGKQSDSTLHSDAPDQGAGAVEHEVHDAPYDHFIAGLFPDAELTVLAYHRVVADRNGLSPLELVGAVAEAGYDVTLSDGVPELERPGQIGLYVDGQWWLLEDLDREEDDLDVDHLQRRVLAPVLGIGDPREDPRISFIGGNEEPEALERAAGAEGVAFLLHPTQVSQLMAVADRGDTMPPKSTWFEPKLRSGLLLHPLS